MEFLAAWMYQNKIPFVWMYHIFVLFEYTLLSLYLMKNLDTKYKKFILFSIPCFIVASLCISYWIYNFNAFPGININVEGILLFITSILMLFSLDVKVHEKVSRNPDFWIICGLLVFFGGTFFSNGIYTYLHTVDKRQAERLFSLINKPSNIFLYATLIIGFLCAMPRRSTLPSP